MSASVWPGRSEGLSPRFPLSPLPLPNRIDRSPIRLAPSPPRIPPMKSRRQPARAPCLRALWIGQCQGTGIAAGRDMADIFISYARADLKRMLPFAQALQAMGYSVWYDARIKAGETFDEVIDRELGAALCVVVVWSEHSVLRRWVRSEATDGLGRGILVPLRIDDVRLPRPFDTVQTPDLSMWQGETDDPAWEQVLEAVAALCGPDLDQGQTGEARGPSPEPFSAGSSQSVFPDMVEIRPEETVFPGAFCMGSPAQEEGRYSEEGPQHHVSFTHAFALGRTPVTFADYDRFCAATERARPDDNGWGRESRPVINVSVSDAQAYCAWLTRRLGQTYRLPTEAEWEYACRAGTGTRYWFGDDPRHLEDHVWCGANAGGRTQPVGAEGHANPWGLSDMHGNVWEWCSDCWHPSYDDAPAAGRAWMAEHGGDCARAVVRGGSWGDYARDLRSACRNVRYRSDQSIDRGFRLAMDLEQ